MALPASGVQANTFLQPDDKFWSLYLKDAHAYDKVRMERWKGDADGILIFTGLFAATVATFAVSSYASLLPDTGSQTVILLAQNLASTNSTSAPAHMQSAILTGPVSFHAPVSVVWISALWFLSPTTAVAAALLATLVQQWTGPYGHEAHRQGLPRVRGPVHVFLTKGLYKFGMEHGHVNRLVTAYIRGAVFVGLLVYLLSAHEIIASLCLRWVSFY